MGKLGTQINSYIITFLLILGEVWSRKSENGNEINKLVIQYCFTCLRFWNARLNACKYHHVILESLVTATIQLKYSNLSINYFKTACNQIKSMLIFKLGNKKRLIYWFKRVKKMNTTCLKLELTTRKRFLEKVSDAYLCF